METELHEFITRFNSIFKTERKIEPIFLALGLVLKLIFKVPLPNGIFISIFTLFLLTFPSSYFLKKQKDIERAESVCFIYWLLNISFITIIVYFLGNIWWIGLCLIVFPIAHSNILLSRRRGLILTFYASTLYVVFAILEYFGTIPHQGFFTPSPALYQNPFYLLITLMTGSIIVFPYIAYVTGDAAEMLRKRTKDLFIISRELEEAKTNLEAKVEERTRELAEAKTSLEIKVKARTIELEELAQSLEDKIKKRTKELRERVEELERFRALTVDRELKMVELKEELEKLKKRISRKK